MNSKRIIAFSIAIVIIIVFALWGYILFLKDNTDDGTFGELEFTSATSAVVQYDTEIRESSPVFIHETLDFSFNYPEHFTVSRFSENENREIILVQRAEDNVGVQIAIAPFDEAGSVLTVQRLQRDIPNLRMQDAREILLEGRAVGITFLNTTSKDAVREVWFVQGQHLFQVTATETFQDALVQIMSTWRFNK